MSIKTARERDLDILKRTGSFDSRGALGQTFRREHENGHGKALYDMEVGREAKAKFRREWAARVFADVLQGKEYNSSWREVDRRAGAYLTLGAIVQAYGGWEWPPAIAGAKLTCSKCALFGRQLAGQRRIQRDDDLLRRSART